MTLPDHVRQAAQHAYAETTGYQLNEVDFADSGIGEALDAGVQAALQALWQPIGWIPLDEDGEPFRATVSNRYQNMFRENKDRPTRKRPVTVYATEGKAKQYSPISKAAPVAPIPQPKGEEG